jgi:hypothetical protein
LNYRPWAIEWVGGFAADPGTLTHLAENMIKMVHTKSKAPQLIVLNALSKSTINNHVTCHGYGSMVGQFWNR